MIFTGRFVFKNKLRRQSDHLVGVSHSGVSSPDARSSKFEETTGECLVWEFKLLVLFPAHWLALPINASFDKRRDPKSKIWERILPVGSSHRADFLLVAFKGVHAKLVLKETF